MPGTGEERRRPGKGLFPSNHLTDGAAQESNLPSVGLRRLRLRLHYAKKFVRLKGTVEPFHLQFDAWFRLDMLFQRRDLWRNEP
jgi:hypothetical protein